MKLAAMKKEKVVSRRVETIGGALFSPAVVIRREQAFSYADISPI